MSDTKPEHPPWINHFFAVIPNAEGNAIFMRPGPEGWQLPYVRAQGIWLSATKHISALLRAEAGLNFDFTILRYAAIEVNESERWDRILFILEPAAALYDIPGDALGNVVGDGQWMDAATLQSLSLAQPEQRAPLLNYLAENAAHDAIDPRRSPWARPGWFATASAWITAATHELGRTPSGAIEQLRNWSISSLLVAPTTDGSGDSRLFFKAAAALPLFVNEPALTQTLAALFPMHIPTPLKIDRDQRWMLMEDFGTHTWDEDNIDLAPILVAYGTLQRASAQHLDALYAAGCIDRRLNVLATQIDALIADPTTQSALTADEHAELAALAPTLKARCAEVAAYNLPATLLHGDLHLGNITQRGHEYIFFDWTDAAISFPFLDLFQLYFDFDATEARDRWRDAYLELWVEYASPARLREVWELAKPLCALHHAISYLTIVNHIEPLVRDELHHGLPDNLHRLLACFRVESHA